MPALVQSLDKWDSSGRIGCAQPVHCRRGAWRRELPLSPDRLWRELDLQRQSWL